MRFCFSSLVAEVFGVLSNFLTLFCLTLGSSEDFGAIFGAERWEVVDMGEDLGRRNEAVGRAPRRAWRRGIIVKVGQQVLNLFETLAKQGGS